MNNQPDKPVKFIRIVRSENDQLHQHRMEMSEQFRRSRGERPGADK